jgi:hypothetical protein
MVLITIFAPDPKGYLWPYYIITPVALIGANLMCVVYTILCILAYFFHKYALEVHCRISATISLFSFVIGLIGNIILDYWIFREMRVSPSYMGPVIFIGLWLIYLGVMDSLIKTPVRKRLKIGVILTSPIMFIGTLGTIASIIDFPSWLMVREMITGRVINMICTAGICLLIWSPLKMKLEKKLVTAHDPISPIA